MLYVNDYFFNAALIIIRGKQLVRNSVEKTNIAGILQYDASTEERETSFEKPTPNTANAHTATVPTSEFADNSAGDASGSNNVPYRLPGADEHPILRLSDAEFRATPVDVQYGWYGEASGGGSCAEDFGNQLIKKWRGVKQPYCSQAETAPAGATVGTGTGVGAGGSNGDTMGGDSKVDLNSSIDCYLVHQTRHHGNGDNLCHMRNVAVDLALFADNGHTRGVIQKYVDTRHAQQPYVKFPKGFIEGDCVPDKRKWQVKLLELCSVF